jgi:hypothetical protein
MISVVLYPLHPKLLFHIWVYQKYNQVADEMVVEKLKKVIKKIKS